MEDSRELAVVRGGEDPWTFRVSVLGAVRRRELKGVTDQEMARFALDAK
jgi:hypothetical protein